MSDHLYDTIAAINKSLDVFGDRFLKAQAIAMSPTMRQQLDRESEPMATYFGMDRSSTPDRTAFYFAGGAYPDQSYFSHADAMPLLWRVGRGSGIHLLPKLQRNW